MTPRPCACEAWDDCRRCAGEGALADGTLCPTCLGASILLEGCEHQDEVRTEARVALLCFVLGLLLLALAKVLYG